MLRGNANNSRGYFLFLAHPHPVFLAKSHGIFMFSEICGVFVNDMTKCVCLLIIDVCINCRESHMAVFFDRILFTSAYGCIFVCIVVWYFRNSGVT